MKDVMKETADELPYAGRVVLKVAMGAVLVNTVMPVSPAVYGAFRRCILRLQLFDLHVGFAFYA